ncbi:hypothetical protein BH18ACT15_BH18ACT15_15340 [soil metagenome]
MACFWLRGLRESGRNIPPGEGPLQTRFTVDEKEAFRHVSGRLVDGYGKWVAELGETVDPWIVELLLDYKWGYGDGDLVGWTRDDLAGFLVGWFPRKVTAGDETLSLMPVTLVTFFAYLENEGLLRAKPDARRLSSSIPPLIPELMAAVNDPARFGPAKQIATEMTADGIDLSNEAAVARWIEDYNARPLEERGGPGPSLSDFSAPLGDFGLDELPRVRLAAEHELAEAASRSPALERMRSFVTFLGRGLKLTQKGNLTLADGKALIDVLGTDDTFDEAIGGRVFHTKSTTELPGVHLTYRWARAAGFVKVRHGKVSPTARGSRLGRKPLDDFRDAVDGLLEGKLVWHWWPDDRRPFWAEYLDDSTMSLLERLYVEAEPLSVEEIKSTAWADVDHTFALYDITDTQREVWSSWVGRDVERTIVASLVDLGAVARDGDEIALTELGRWGANRALNARGYDAPFAGELVAASVPVLLGACAPLPQEVAAEEVALWLAASPDRPEEFFAALDGIEDARLRVVATLGFDALGETYMKRLAERPEWRPFVKLWRIEKGLEPQLDDVTEDPDLVIVSLAACLAGTDADRDRLVGALMALGTEADQMTLLGAMWRSEQDAAGDVLEAVGSRHPSKAVAKAARKALFKRRSAGLESDAAPSLPPS